MWSCLADCVLKFLNEPISFWVVEFWYFMHQYALYTWHFIFHWNDNNNFIDYVYAVKTGLSYVKSGGISRQAVFQDT